MTDPRKGPQAQQPAEGEALAATARRKSRRQFGSIRRLPSKRYQVRYRGPDGRMVTAGQTWEHKADATRFLTFVQGDMARGSYVDPRQAKRTVADLAAEWLTANPGKRSGTLARDETIVRVQVIPAVGAFAIGAVTPADVQRAVNRWATTMAPATVERVYGVLRAVCNLAVARDCIARTPCRGIKLPAKVSRERYVVDADDLARLADALEAQSPGAGLMAIVAAITGLRWGEVAGLRVRDVDVLGRVVTVAQQVTRGAGGKTVVNPPKSHAGRRTLSIPGPLAELVGGHLVARGLTAADGDALVFVRPEGSPLDYSGWRNRVWVPGCVAAELGALTKVDGKERYTGLGFHDLRRAAATVLVAEGVDVKTAQSRLGHSDPRLTLGLYAQVVSEADRSAADRVGARLMGGTTRRPTPSPLSPLGRPSAEATGTPVARTGQ